MYYRDTIAAIATPAGPGGIGIVRASGPEAERLADNVFSAARDGGAWESHRLYHGRIIGADRRPLDDALAVLMRAPHSYTGEDVLELHCHGSPILLRRVLALLLEHGARPAEPGEFTKRAFLNGKLDLTQAEAVADLIGARTADALTAAADQLFGRLSAHLATLRERLIRARAHLEVQLDFSEDEVDLDPRTLAAELERVRADVRALLETYGRGRLLREGLRVAITGRPNVGKSSLLNALLGADRAIVTAHPGTTRDVIEETADFGGVPVLLADTAGLRDGGDEVEQIGIARAHRVIAAADVVLAVLDTARPLAPQLPLPDGVTPIVVLNKIDLPCAWSTSDHAALAAERETVAVSATVPLGLDALRQAVTQRAIGAWSDHLPTLTSARQHAALQHVEASLAAAVAAVANGTAPDLVAVDVQAALDHLGAVTGVVTSDDVLDAVFREFCIGK
jgi:tRNA modification GTPase